MDYIHRSPHEINNTKGLTQNVITKGFNILILENVKITVLSPGDTKFGKHKLKIKSSVGMESSYVN